jgi:TolB-like protein/cytochrome c-type biogenesis protein CcmH/NrfG
LPFVNLSSDPQQEHFSDGLSEELLILLGRIPDLRVISRTSSFRYKGKDIDIPTIAKELDVAHVLEGSVRTAGDRIRVTAQLIDARSDEHVWSRTFDLTLDDIVVVQDEIAQAVATALETTFRGASTTTVQVDPRAYALFLQGNYLSRLGTPESMEAAIGAYQAAIEIMPGYALAWDGLSRTYGRQADRGFLPVAEASALMRDTALRALSIDPQLARGYDRLGWIAMTYDRDFATAARHYARALALDPHDLTIVGGAAVLAQHIGRLEQAADLLEYVVARDPVNPGALVNLGNTYLYAARWDEAIDRYRTALTLTPGRAGIEYNIGVALLQKGDAQSALAAMQRESVEVWQQIGLAMASHALGRSADSDTVLAQLHERYAMDAAYNIAYVHAYRNEADAAFDWLERARRNDDSGLAEIANEPMFGRLHADPRWEPLLFRLGRSKDQLAAIEFDVRRPGALPAMVET